MTKINITKNEIYSIREAYFCLLFMKRLQEKYKIIGPMELNRTDIKPIKKLLLKYDKEIKKAKS